MASDEEQFNKEQENAKRIGLHRINSLDMRKKAMEKKKGECW
jgi:hypothetical protein